MLIIKVKICGITNYDDAIAAAEMGADFIGFNFYEPSPRYIEPAAAAEIAKKLPAFVYLAGVFVNAPLDTVRDVAALCQLEWVQLHGDEDPDFCRWLSGDNLKTIKAVRVRESDDLKKIHEYAADAILLDAFHPDKYGGTGLTFDWSMIGHLNRRVLLAGGINPDNAADAAELGVYGIDVCSGIESEPGKKDHDKMRQLLENIRHLRA